MASKLLNETTYAQEKLNNPPDNVADFVEYSEFLNSTNQRQARIVATLTLTLTQSLTLTLTPTLALTLTLTPTPTLTLPGRVRRARRCGARHLRSHGRILGGRA